MSGIGPVRCGSKNVVDELQEVWEIPDGRLVSDWVGEVLLSAGNLASECVGLELSLEDIIPRRQDRSRRST